MRVSDLLARKGRDVFWVPGTTTVAAALGRLAEHNIGALVVSPDGQTLEGMFSERDVVRALAQSEHILNAQVRTLATPDPVWCTVDQTVDELATLMTRGRFRHVPVLCGATLCGLVSIGDVVLARLEALDRDYQMLVDYIRSGR